MTANETSVGRPVIYWEPKVDGSRSSRPHKAVITSTSERKNGDSVCKILLDQEEVEVSISLLDTLSPGSILAARLSGLDLGPHAFENATREFFNSRGVNVIINNNDKLE